jgi:hypothetical protein
MSSEGQRSLGLFFRTADNHHGEKVGLSIRIHLRPCDCLKRRGKGFVREPRLVLRGIKSGSSSDVSV